MAAPVNIAADTSSPDALALQGELCLAQGDIQKAADHYALAIKADPANPALKSRFIELAAFITVSCPHPEMEAALFACLSSPEVDCSEARALWQQILMQDPDFSKIYKHSTAGGVATFDRDAFGKANWQPLLNPFFLCGLRKVTVYSFPFEEFLTHLRLWLLDTCGTEPSKPMRAEVAGIAEALAHYCQSTEYIFATTQDEMRKIAELRHLLETDDEVMNDPCAIAIYACYAPLWELKTAEKIAKLHAGGPAAGLIKAQIADHAALERRKEGVAALTEIRDALSLKVQAQYEEFPYPCWTGFAKVAPEKEERALRGKKAQILVAGCGTGREAITLASAFPDSEILAVDLSRASLAYAAGRAEDFGIGNVTFRQADILHLGVIGRTFDLVSSSGVLHHMADPLEGWAVLRGILKPGGYMRVGLYSRLARRFIAEARRAVAANSYLPNVESMKAFRARSPKILRKQTMQDITHRGDYYHLSMYRDMLFHVREHSFDIPGIAGALQQLGLEFLGFGFNTGIPESYRAKYPSDPVGASLDNWHAFEKENPDTFSHMYHIWCREKA
ncbi:MAG: class I SAM-dependent methyltransferase [Alphaproteobacteria bacterium]|nr:MAG: class I SAM-dependent methyltransferase [Alphaproteobacteria bacterium]